jgi:YD repeat-containing protein
MGHVRLVIDTTAIPGTPEVIERRKYAPDGCLTERVISTGGELPHIFISACDGYGRKEEEREYIQHDNTPITTTKYRYNSRGYMIEESISKYKDHTWLNHGYTYDANGHKTSERTVDGSDILNWHTFIYDTAGYLQADSGMEDGGRRTNHIYRRDGKGHILESISNECSRSGCATIKELSKYDAKGNAYELIHSETDTDRNFKNIIVYQDTFPVVIRQYTSKGLNFLRSAKYDKKGHILETTYRSYLDEHPVHEKYSYQWNEHGDKTEEVGYNADGTVAYKMTFEYIYDSAGNIIRQTRIKDGLPIVIMRRQVEYY